MKKFWQGLMLFFACTIVAVATGCGNSAKQAAQAQKTIYVSAAASLTNVMQELGKDYEKENPTVAVKFNFAGSGALQAQIEQGAPADLFISASPKQMKALQTKGLLDDSTEKPLLENSIVLIVPKDSKLQLTSFKDLTKDNIKKIAVGNPQGVPAGQYAEQVFTALHLQAAIKDKVVYAANVRQVLAWIEENDADCGIVYATDAKITDKVKVILTAPADTHKPVVYPVAVLKDAKQPAAAKSFEAYLSSPAAKQIFEKYGFTMAK